MGKIIIATKILMYYIFKSGMFILDEPYSGNHI